MSEETESVYLSMSRSGYDIRYAIQEIAETIESMGFKSVSVWCHYYAGGDDLHPFFDWTVMFDNGLDRKQLNSNSFADLIEKIKDQRPLDIETQELLLSL